MVVTAYVAKITDRRSEVNCPLAFEARPYLQVSRTWGQGGDNIVGGYGSANALERKLANRFDGYGVFDRHQNTRANQNLTRLGFVTQPGCDVGHRPDSGIVEASLETDGAERGISVCYANAKADLVDCSGPGSLNRFSASLSGVSAGVRLPCGWAAG